MDGASQVAVIVKERYQVSLYKDRFPASLETSRSKCVGETDYIIHHSILYVFYNAIFTSVHRYSPLYKYNQYSIYLNIYTIIFVPLLNHTVSLESTLGEPTATRSAFF